jgi:polyketide synthase PksN
MEERVAFAADSMSELSARLKAFIDGDEHAEGLHRGQVKRNKDALSVFASDDELQEAVAKWIQRGKHEKLLGLWVKGLSVDWALLYGAHTPARISLPTYPFARERYWVPEAVQAAPAVDGALLHPLLHRNTSDLSGPRFSSELSGAEFFLAEHQVGGAPVLPGVAYLEMAREALAQVAGVESLTLTDLVWLQPFVPGPQAGTLHVGLHARDDGMVGVEIYSGGPESPRVHARASARLDAEILAPLDLAALRSRCGDTLDPAQCYARFDAAGIAYGPAYRGMEQLLLGDGQLLARVRAGAQGAGQFGLHPGLMDSAFQATAGLLGQGADGQGPRCPMARARCCRSGKRPRRRWYLRRH